MNAAENTSTERCTLRYLVAQIVLATDVPMPEQISVFDEGSVSLRLPRNDEAHAWAQFLGAKAEPYLYEGDRYAGVRGTTWHGWYVQINASEPAESDAEIDAETTAALSAVPALEDAPPRGTDAAEEHEDPPAEVDGYSPTGRG